MSIDINLNDVQVKPIVVNADLTAVLDRTYNVVASAIFTDPTPNEGKGFIVFVRNGTATVGGVGYSTAGTVIRRIYHSGAWANYTGTSVDVNTIGAAINGAASATPNDTDLVMSVEGSVAKKNTWTQIKSFLKTYFDTVYQAAGTYLTSANITQTITNGVTDKAPSEDAVYDALALKVNTTDPHLLFQGVFAATNLADSVSYYFSNMDGLAATGTQGFSKFGFDRNRKVTKVVLTCSQNVNYSNESVSLYLRKNATTDYTITTTLDLSTVGANTSKVFYYTVDIDVTTGDDYEFKITTPAFGTNGTNSRWHIELYGY